MHRVSAPLAVVLAAALLGSAASARTISTTFSGGGLGQSLSITISGTAGSQYLMLMSLTTGPTILPPPHVSPIDVGLDLAYFSTLVPGFLGTIPNALSLPIPPDPLLDDLNVNFQAFRIQSGATLAEKSNLWRVTFDTPGQYLETLNPLITGRTLATVTRLDATTALVAGGGVGTLTAAYGLDSAELYRTNLETFDATANNMTTSRALHRAVLLDDGRVLLVGGVDANGDPTNTAEVFNPATGLFTAVGSMATPRMGHTATKIAGGKVLVTGGSTAVSATDVSVVVTSATDTTELFDPVTNTFSSGPKLSEPKTFHDATALATGDVLASGGLTYTVIPIVNIKVPAFSSKAQVSNIALNKWTSISGSMTSHRAGHTGIRLNDGRILLAGGVDGSITLIPPGITTTILSSCEYYDPATNKCFVAGSFSRARALAGLTMLADHTILASGGAEGSLTAPNAIDTNERYVPVAGAAGSWAAAGTMTTSRLGHVAIFLDDGTVGLIGGAGGPSGTTLNTAEIYQP